MVSDRCKVVRGEEVRGKNEGGGVGRGEDCRIVVLGACSRFYLAQGSGGGECVGSKVKSSRGVFLFNFRK